MKIISAIAAAALVLTATASGAAAGSFGAGAVKPLPPPAMNMSVTTPMTNSSPRILPQARQVGNPTGPVPNQSGLFAPTRQPQAPQIGQLCPDYSKPPCKH